VKRVKTGMKTKEEEEGGIKESKGRLNVDVVRRKKQAASEPFSNMLPSFPTQFITYGPPEFEFHRPLLRSHFSLSNSPQSCPLQQSVGRPRNDFSRSRTWLNRKLGFSLGATSKPFS
jgi:hypothetical protein